MRVEGWERLLNEHIEQAALVEFAWGDHDCALWSADWVKKVTANDFTSCWRGLYSNEDELKALLIARGIRQPEDIADEVGLPQIPVGLAQRGDIVLWQGCLGICNGIDSYFLIERGVTQVRTKACTRAWEVR